MDDLSLEVTDPRSGDLGVSPDAEVHNMTMAEAMEALQFNPADVHVPWDSSGHVTAFENVVGTPADDAQYWQLQTTPFTCAVVAQRGIIEAYTGADISEAQLVYDATVDGWLSDGGMSPLDAGRLLDLYGIENHVAMEATIEDLMAELAQGHKVIVGVDSGELWKTDFGLEDFFRQAADHAVWITGVDLSDPNHPQVIINDSGDPAGAGKAYPMEEFVDAWADSGFFYISTDYPPPNFVQVAEGFDPAAGYFPEVVSYFGAHFPEFRDEVQASDPMSVRGMDTGGATASPDLYENSIASLTEEARNRLFNSI